MTNQLPNGWLTIEVGQIADVVSGGTPTASDSSNFAEPGTDIAWLTPADLSGYKRKSISYGARDITQKGYNSSSAKLMPKGSILFSSRAPIGYVAISENKISTNQGFKSFIFSSDVSSDYAYYYFRNIKDIAESVSSGTTFKELSGSAAKKLLFILPPLAEQKEIATLLDNLLAQVDTLKTRLDAIPNILKRFRQSVLAAAVSGKLTEKNTEYEEVSFGELITEMRNGLSPQPNDDKRGYPILRISAVRSLDIDKSDHRFLECDEKTLSIYVLENDDLLFTRYNGSLDFVGVCGLYRGNSNDKFLYPDKLIRVRTKQNRLIPQYAEIFFSSPQTRKVVTDFVKSTSGQKGISGKDLKSVLINLPPIEEQAEIVRRVEELFAFADQIEQRVKVAQQRVNHLTQAILAKAFRGELTAEWREQNPDLISGENSAAALLARIQARNSNNVKASRHSK